MKKTMNGKYMMAIIFLLIILILFLANLSSLWNIVKTEVSAIFNNDVESKIMEPAEMEASYDGNFYKRMAFVNINGLAHRAMGQKIMNGAIRGENENLFLEADVDFKFDKDLEDSNLEDALSILNIAETKGAEVLYVQRPMKFIEGKDQLPYGMTVEYNQQYDYWCKKIKESGINVIDLREEIGDNIDFYKTDHHWTVETSFEAAGAIMEALNRYSGDDFDYNESIFEKSNYNLMRYDNSFLGSEGVKTGEYYVGKDNFNVLVPKFETKVTFKHYVNNECTIDKTGEFSKAFIDEDILLNPDYYNKYNACIYGGYVESIIENKKGGNGKKVLLISDSFARPMVMYFSLAFSETRYLDPQEGRYNDSYIDYIDEYQPDVVVMMYTGAFVEV